MSFGEGNLREKVDDLNRQVDSYKRQLGGMTAAKNRMKGENERLRAELDEQDRHIGGLETLVRQLAEVIALYTELPECLAECMDELGIGVER